MSDSNPNLQATTTSSEKRKPRISIAIATAFGLGYIPKAPGTFGSIGGLVLVLIAPLLLAVVAQFTGGIGFALPYPAELFVYIDCWLTAGLALIGLWSAHRAANYWGIADPQKIVIDEVSGQLLALLLGGGWPWRASPASNAWNNLHPDRPMLWSTHPLGVSAGDWPNWKYLLLGFILFRVFDIWKPFPARQAESLPGGLGIMADDWVAGIYAAMGLWIARALGL